jgi:hypothetical protein
MGLEIEMERRRPYPHQAGKLPALNTMLICLSPLSKRRI